MSRRDRRNKRIESPARPDSPPRDPGSPTVKGTILLTALALVASAVFFWQITRPTSFLSAIMQVEYSRLLPTEKGKPRADGGPTWETVYQQYQERLRKEPVTQRHFAVSDLLDAVVEVERGRRPAGEAVGKMQSRLAVDQDNVISRLAYGALVDAGAAGKSATERFEEWRRIVEQPGPAKVSALYNKEYDDVFLDVLSGYIKRLDVRANLVKCMDHFLVHDHYAALPMIQARLARLADELSAAGKRSEAETCRRWVVRACLGLMEYEPDAGTRLLCADLAGRCLPSDDPLRAVLLKGTTDFKQIASNCPVDLTSLQRAPVVRSDLYRHALDCLFVAGAYAMQGVGCCIVALIACMFALFARLTPKKTLAQPWDQYPPLPRWQRALWLPFLFIGQTLMFAPGHAKAVFSETATYFWLLSVSAATMSIVFFASGIWNERPELRGRRWFIGFLFSVGYLSVFSPASWIAPILRPIEIYLGGLMTIAALVLVTTLIAISYRAAPLAWILRVASAMGLACMCCALVSLSVLASADVGWQTSATSARSDEIAARLGADWQQRYGIPTAAAYALPTTNAAP
ncbi:MAG: hypothetical protein HZA51_00705 [Planctomycetes bacterium]|nr:hypothetical protein [Planctomycetota bacterium]